MTTVQTTNILRALARLDIALEDYQSMMEAGFDQLANGPRTDARDAIHAIRDALGKVERALGLPTADERPLRDLDRPNDDWHEAA